MTADAETRRCHVHEKGERMRTVVRTFVALVVLAVSAVATTAAGGAVQQSAEIYALAGKDRLVGFSAARPGRVETVKVSGLQDGESLIGIDFRPVDGKLWAVVRLCSTGRMYTIDPESGRATFVAMLVNASGGAPIVLVGSSFGLDFNPAADALRIVSDAGQNLRALPSDRLVAGVQQRTGDTFVDGSLNYAGAAAPGVGGAAYTNNDVDPATGTTLFDVDASLDDLVVQNPPNSGGLVKVADLGTPTDAHVGFDIRTLGTTNIAYVATTDQRGKGAALATLRTIDLTTGATESLGKIGGPKAIRGIAVAP
jgi:hypothetical protein